MIEAIALGLLGVLGGGVINVAVDRLPPEEEEALSATAGPPRAAGDVPLMRFRPLRFWEFLPFLSLVGAVQERRTALPNNRLRYPAVELLTGGLFALSWARFEGEWLTLIAACAFIPVFVALIFIDLETQFLPDALVLPAAVAALAISPFWTQIRWIEAVTVIPALRELGGWQGVFGAAVGFGMFAPFAWAGDRLNRPMMGWGDVKFAVMLGALLGAPLLLLGLYLAALVGGLVALVLYAGRLFGFRRALMPFGPYMAIGGLVSLFFGPQMLAWLFG